MFKSGLSRLKRTLANAMKLFISGLLIFLLYAEISLSQEEEEYPEASPTEKPNVVISPYDTNRHLDVTGMKPGSLAEDPVAKKIFRIPESAPSKKKVEDYLGNIPGEDAPEPSPEPPREVIPPPPISPQPPPQDRSMVSIGEVPLDLRNFLSAFNQNSAVNDPDALVPFYAERVESYFGRKNVSRATIRKDREAYIKRFPKREYILDGSPVLLAQNGTTYEVSTRVRYVVQGSGRTRAGAVSDHFKIRRGTRFFEIVSIEEAKAKLPPEEETAPPSGDRQSSRSPVATPPRTINGTAYKRYQTEQISLFLEAFAASGEVNDPAATVEFMHPQIVTYYSKTNPTADEMIKERREYIKRWPERRYWLREKPKIRPLPDGSWEAVTRTGYEVKSGTDRRTGEATSMLRLTHTSRGLKIASIKTVK